MDIDPEEVQTVINQFREHLSYAKTLNSKSFESTILRIWELSREQSKIDFENRKSWKSVMASCNALYDELYTASRGAIRLVRAA